jgi:multidrug efflux system membrane fusion protein
MRIRTIGIIIIGAVALGAVLVQKSALAPLAGYVGLGVTQSDAATGANALTASVAGKTPKAPTRTVVTAVALTGTLPLTRQTVGWITSPASISLTSTQSGTIVQLVGMEGKKVKKADLIAKLDDRIAQAAVNRDNAQVRKDQSAQSQAEAYASRLKTLSDQGSTTKQAYDDAVALATIAASTVAVDQATLSSDQVVLSNTEIRAPFDGRLGAFQVALGSLVQPNAAIVTLTQMNPLQASFSLTQADLQPLRAARRGKTESVHAVSTTSTTSTGNGKVDFIDSTIDPGSGTFKARASLANDALALWPGESVAITVSLGATSPMVLVPAQAVQAAASGFQVYVVKPDHTIDVRNVTLGLSAGGQTGVLTGIQVSEHVVTEGQIRLTPGMSVGETTASPVAAVTSTMTASTTASPASATPVPSTP